MSPRNFHTRGRAGSSRRKTAWTSGPFTSAPASITAAGNTIVLTSQQAIVDGLTIVRIRGSFSAWLEVVTAAGDGFGSIAFGMAIVSENAAGIGVTAVPSPLDDIVWNGWIVHQVIAPVIGFSTTESENTGPVSQVRFDFDSKAMRKWANTDVIIAALAVTNEVGTATLTFGMRSRVLVKLP